MAFCASPGAAAAPGFEICLDQESLCSCPRDHFLSSCFLILSSIFLSKWFFPCRHPGFAPLFSIGGMAEVKLITWFRGCKKGSSPIGQALPARGGEKWTEPECCEVTKKRRDGHLPRTLNEEWRVTSRLLAGRRMIRGCGRVRGSTFGNV